MDREETWAAGHSGGTNGNGFVSGSAKALHQITGGTRYQAVASDGDDGFPAKNNVVVPEPFEMELLSDIEGSSENPRRAPDNGFSENDKWMRDVWAVPNRAVVMSYFCVGFAMRFLTTPLSYYAVHVIGASPAQQNVLLTLAQLPWSFKLVYGFVSDNFPIGGMRRKPYFIMGWAVYVLVNLFTATMEQPSINWLAGAAFVSTVGFMFSDVTTDAILVERSKHETREKRGTMQATGYSVRFMGSLCGSVLGMVLYNKEKWGWGLSIRQLFLLNGVFPLVFTGPWVWHLRETAVTHAAETPVKQRIKAQCADVFRALELKAVYGPMAIIFVYNFFQIPNAAWRSFLVDGLNFSSFDLGILAVVGSLMASAGLLTYKKWFFHSSWRKIYIWTTLVTAFFSGFQILLILRVNKYYGIGDLVFSIGDDSIYDFVSSIQFLPVVQMYISMCPDGAEGTTYAILTTMSNVSMAAAFMVGTLFTKIWDVSNDALSRGEFSGMWKLTLLTSVIQPLPLLLIRRLPANQAEQRALQLNGAKSRWGGIALLTILFSSLFVTVIMSIVELGDG